MLIGITRNFVIKLAQQAGFVVEERELKISELQQATEAFITASNKEILPITDIDGKKIGIGSVGTHTRKLIDMYQQAVADAVMKSKNKN